MRRESQKKKKKDIRYLTGQQKKIRDTIRLARTVLSKTEKDGFLLSIDRNKHLSQIL